MRLTRRRVLAGVAAVLIVAVAGATAYVLAQRQAARDVLGSSTEEFVVTDLIPERPEIRAPAPSPSAPRPEPVTLDWPTWGMSAERVRISPYVHRPPFQPRWSFGAGSLVELAPVVGLGNVYFANNTGTVFALDAETGKAVWRFATGRTQAATPALAGRTLFHTFLYRTRVGKRDPTGEVVALDARTGKVRWRRTIAPSESSPLVYRGTLYVGDWSGTVHALNPRTGGVRWTFRTRGDVKGGITATGDTLFVGSYDHHVYALDARTGEQRWRASVQDRLGTLGRFYSTPAAAYGRVYVGATDGKVYSYGATTGELRWSRSTGSYVYGSPAVANRTVFVGSYDGRFYAFDAATGETRWRFGADGPISGSATVVGDLVYFSTLRGRTYALDTRTGAARWTFGDGKYAGVVADPDRLYLVGVGTVYAFESR